MVVGAIVAATVLLAASAMGVALRRRNGHFRIMTAGETTTASALDPALAGLGVTTGTPVTLLQFSSAFCAPCRTTRVHCAEVAGTVPGVRHLEVDAESHLDAVRALDVWRTPTVLIIDAAGTVRRRASGAPTRAQLLAAVADLLPRTGMAVHGAVS